MEGAGLKIDMTNISGMSIDGIEVEGVVYSIT